MKRTAGLLTLASLLVTTAIYASRKHNLQQRDVGTRQTLDDPRPTPPKARAQARPKVDIVIALDTSGSMSGLIDAARHKLWDIVNEIAKVQPAPRLRVGLVTFGSQGSENDGYVVMQTKLTTDLDGLYAKLAALRTSGGTEYVARTIKRSVTEFDWDRDPDTLRQIYVAGNESANQDRRVTLTRALALAKKGDIYVNAIFCGTETHFDASSWRDVAEAGNGMFASIDHNHGTVVVASPYDRKLNALSQKLNATYIPYGTDGRSGAARQREQDQAANALHGASAAERAVAKSSSVYTNAKWDLVDAMKSKRGVPRSALPAPLAKMSSADRDAYVKRVDRQRAQIKAEIQRLAKKRKEYVAGEMRAKGLNEGKSFNQAIKRALKKQAAEKNLVLH